MNVPTRQALRVVVLRGALAVVITAVYWVLAGFLVTAPLGAIYGWSGHPAIPDAPMAVYVVVYLIALPVVCGAAAWKTTRWLASRLRRPDASRD